MNRKITTTAALIAAGFALTACTTGGTEPTPTVTVTTEAPPVAGDSAETAPAGFPEYGKPYTTTHGLIVTVAEPAPEDISGYGDLGANTTGVRLDITLENPTDTPVVLSGGLGFDAFSGATAGEYLMCDDDATAPSTLPAGRTASWPECFALETTDDAIFTVNFLDSETWETVASVSYGLN